jgi:regulatory protein
MDLDAQTLGRAKQLAYRFLAYRSQTSHELKDRLQRRGHTAAVIGEVLRQLEAEGYIDDRKFAREWARYRLQGKPLGRRRLFWELQRRGIPRESLEDVLREVYAEFDEVALAEQAARKRLGSRNLPHTARECQRFVRHLTGLGFDADTIAIALGRVSPLAIPPELVPDDNSD